MLEKRIDEDWKARIAKERVGAEPQPEQRVEAPGHARPQPPPTAPRPSGGEEPASQHEEAAATQQFEQFISTLSMEALIHLGDVPHPVTRQPQQQLEQARYVIDLLALLQAKTRGNLTRREAQLLDDAIYQLRMRYVQVTGDVNAPGTTP